MQQDKLVSSVELLSDSVNRQTERAWVEMRPLRRSFCHPKALDLLLHSDVPLLERSSGVQTTM